MENKVNLSNTRTISTPNLLTLRQVHTAFQGVSAARTGPRREPDCSSSCSITWAGEASLETADIHLSISNTHLKPKPLQSRAWSTYWLPPVLFCYLIITPKEAFNCHCTYTLYRTAFQRKACCRSEIIWDINVLKIKSTPCWGCPGVPLKSISTFKAVFVFFPPLPFF